MTNPCAQATKVRAPSSAVGLAGQRRHRLDDRIGQGGKLGGIRTGAGRQVGEQQAVPVRVPVDEVAVGIGHRPQVGVRITGFGRPRQRSGEIGDHALGDGSYERGSIRDTLVGDGPWTPTASATLRIVTAARPSVSRIRLAAATIASTEVRDGAGLMDRV